MNLASCVRCSRQYKIGGETSYESQQGWEQTLPTTCNPVGEMVAAMPKDQSNIKCETISYYSNFMDLEASDFKHVETMSGSSSARLPCESKVINPITAGELLTGSVSGAIAAGQGKNTNSNTYTY